MAAARGIARAASTPSGVTGVAATSGAQTLYSDPADRGGLICDVGVRRLQVNRDPRGILVETLRTDWADCYHAPERAFGQSYYSATEPWVARDEDRWHVHQRQSDRFIVPLGDVVVALYDPREGSSTRGRLNLVRLGGSNGDGGQYLVLIPPRVLHGFVVVSATPALLLNYPTHLWDAADEGRVPFADADARLPDGRAFAWDVVREVERKAASGPERARAEG